MPDYIWSPTTGRYRDVQSGRYVAESVIRADVERVVAATQDRIARLTERLTTGELNPVLWRTQMAQTLSSAHLTSASLAHGGWASLDGPTQAWTAARLRGELAYLGDFTTAIQLDLLTPAQIGARAAMYGDGVYVTYQERRRTDAGARGHDQERNLLGAADHCAGCTDATGQGWVPLGTLPAVGGRQCRSRCRCRITTRKARIRTRVEA